MNNDAPEIDETILLSKRVEVFTVVPPWQNRNIKIQHGVFVRIDVLFSY